MEIELYDNIKKDVQFLLSSNIGEVLTIFCASVLNLIPGISLGVPLRPIHLLWVNLITVSLPAFALGMEKADSDIMNRKPRSKEEGFFSHHLGWTIAWQGAMIGALRMALSSKKTAKILLFFNQRNNENGESSIKYISSSST